MHFAVLQFPASNCDQDAIHAIHVLGHSARYVWHKERSLGGADAVIVPGGFSYGDYLRCGACAVPVRHASGAGIRRERRDCSQFATAFRFCARLDFFQRFVRNRSLRFGASMSFLKTLTNDSPFPTGFPPGLLRIDRARRRLLRCGRSHLGEPEAQRQSLALLRRQGITESANQRLALNIAGICNERQRGR